MSQDHLRLEAECRRPWVRSGVEDGTNALSRPLWQECQASTAEALGDDSFHLQLPNWTYFPSYTGSEYSHIIKAPTSRRIVQITFSDHHVGQSAL